MLNQTKVFTITDIQMCIHCLWSSMPSFFLFFLALKRLRAEFYSCLTLKRLVIHYPGYNWSYI